MSGTIEKTEETSIRPSRRSGGHLAEQATTSGGMLDKASDLPALRLVQPPRRYYFCRLALR
jgi:hypothetical protein